MTVAKQNLYAFAPKQWLLTVGDTVELIEHSLKPPLSQGINARGLEHA
jgi:hypothetical protein